MARTDYTSGAAGASGGAIGTGGDDDDGYSVETLRRQYMDFHGAKHLEIAEQRIARHYYHGDQLTKTELNELKRRGQPATVRNKISRKINGVIGLIERLRQDPKAFPRTPKHEEGAEIATATVRYILDANNWNALSANEARDGAINGIFGLELGLIEGDQGDPDIGLGEIDNDTFFYDPRSFKFDFSDARYMGVAKWVDIDVAKEMFPDREEELESLVNRSSGAESFQQHDREFKWIDTNEKRLFLVEHWHIAKGEWRFCFWCSDVKLASGVSPFKDEKGKTISRYVLGSCNVDHDGDRYGFVRDLKPLQDEINARASKSLHLLNVRRIIAEVGAVADVDKARREASRPDGYIEVNPNKRFEFDDQARLSDLKGQVEAMMEAKDEIENFGPNPALIGQGIENKSGRAIALLQQAGIAELGPYILSYRDWKIRVYRAVWTAAKQFWQGERWLRVTDHEGMAQFIQINGLQIDPETGHPSMVNALGSLDVDILIDEGPDVLNVMQDTHETLKALAQAGAQVPPVVLIETSDLPSTEKTKIRDLIEQSNQPSPFDEAVMEGKVAELQGKVRKVNAEASKTEAEIESGPVRDRAAAFRDVASAASQIAKIRQPQMPMDVSGF